MYPLTENGHPHVNMLGNTNPNNGAMNMSDEKQYPYKMNDLLSTGQAAEFLGISRQRMNVLLHDGYIEEAFQTANKQWFIPFHAILNADERTTGRPRNEDDNTPKN